MSWQRAERDWGCGQQSSGAGRLHTGQVQTDRGTAWETPARRGHDNRTFLDVGRGKLGLETAEREEELGVWQVLGTLGKKIKTSLQINIDRNGGTKAALVVLPH